MDPSRSTLAFELQQLLEDLQAFQDTLNQMQGRAAALFEQLSASDDELAGVKKWTVAEGEKSDDPFDLNPDFDRLLEKEFAKEARTDHYVELPFVDPYDCFDDASPEFGFPYSDRTPTRGPLEGLFESDPEIASAPSGSTELRGPDVEIEYLPNGGYRMRSQPSRHRTNEAPSTDPLDGLSS
ncbi:MAG: hypothetical protein ACI9R3_003919 [Verrucomicrobiales bacterium]|jgi:hypothetical protein